MGRTVLPRRHRASADYLSLYARAFDTVEVDSTFYAIPASKVVRGWAARVPDNFLFALKLPQEITHEKRLRGAEDATALFFDRARELGHKLGPVLIQLGPDFGPNELPALAAYLPTLPRDLQIAIEFRDKRWLNDGVIALLAEYRVALTLTMRDGFRARRCSRSPQRPTADFAYVRWMGPDRDIVDYSRLQFDRTREIEQWSESLLMLIQKVTAVYGYVNNHFAGHSPASARQLQRLFGQTPVDPNDLGEQISLF